ncbi:ZP domain-containing protein [Caenorhabditis elegans]|uniref:ZP domain-containing protein n=3 Tax=Caenorhabditis elegans TaxID=6239 RepID=A0A131MBI8_CAEEL|nr:ZP domain-containing protein [Caenorhabditis elegans]CZR14494.1 ZP domain-containing protein [Caenorhabditis elegans]|eukprot:NP_001309578.1 CUTiclin-Like [Caenorhabditis elegans]
MTFVNCFMIIIFVVKNVIADNSNYNFYYTHMEPPKLECGSEGIRLHINPTGTFGGHVYVRGFFPQTVCHLNYCTRLTNRPIVMDLPFRGPCNVRRRRNVAPPSISYDVTVIIQHHPLFVTSFDKAYRLNCIYRQQESTLQQRINVSDIPSTALQSKNAPKCRYDVLSGSLNGPVVRFANVGDVVVHKWTCDSDRFGFVVHSCVVRDESGKDFQFIDERGCVTDFSLFPEVSYSDDLKSAFTAVRAFRYADQVMVHFSCQITTCQKQENGCEGISPPICRPMDLGPIKVHYVKHEKNGEKFDEGGGVETLPPRTENTSEGSTTTVRSTTTRERAQAFSTTTHKTTTSSSLQLKTVQRDEDNNSFSPSSKFRNGYNFPNVESGEGVGQDNTAEFGVKRKSSDAGVNEYGIEIAKDESQAKQNKISLVAEPEKLPKREVFHVETISKTMDSELEPLPYPTKASVYQHRSPRSHKRVLEDANITLEVETTKIMILENEPSAEKFRLGEAREQSGPEPMKCTTSENYVSNTLLLTTLGVLQVISILALITQRFYYKKSIDNLIYADDRPGSRKF